ncbi:RNA-guided endonuclease TnpB family protein [Coleofasciculus sp. FACHB-T130]|uniref:RNA-guided endonuclease TnpB family protein n=1 Tax=Cyanophyceae TaxID=3028117 RepID=UPI001684F512|nr:IS200/IS605 family element transposase accessory protein TnpB [Coleofasciculus sp. FACHB-T130]
MFASFVYKLKPSPRQAATMERWLDMLRGQYNFRLKERIEAYEQVRSPILGNYCDIKSQAECCPLTCSVSKSTLYGSPWKTDKKTGAGKRRSAWEIQSADLVRLKQERPWYKEMSCVVLQQMLRQLDTAFQNFFEQGRGYPRFKPRNCFKSFTYSPGAVKFKGNAAYLPGIGWMKFFQSRSFPDGFAQRSVTVRKKADGWYISVRLQDDTVPETPLPNQVKTAVGVDLGIKKLMSLSTGETVPNPEFYRQQERRRRIRQRRASRKAKGSNKQVKAYQRLAKLEQKISNQREDYQWKSAHKLVKNFDLIVFEDLNIQGMKRRCKPKQCEATGKYLRNNQAAKSALNRAISDAAWGNLKQKVKILAEKSGVLFCEVNPRHSSQECSECGYVSPTNRDKEKFVCESCGHHADADVDAAIVILNRGLEELGIETSQLPGGTRKVTLKEPVGRQGTSLGLPGEPGNPHQFQPYQGVQLKLFEWMGA